MRVLLCSTGINALGETFTLAIFAQELSKDGVDCYFIAPQLGRNYLLTFGFSEEKVLLMKGTKFKDTEKQKNKILNENYRLLKEYVCKIHPNLIIVGDWHHYNQYGTSNNNSYSLVWFDDRIPFVSFDHIGFAPEGKKVGQNEIFHKLQRKTQCDFFVKDYIPLSDRYSAVIRPCPHHDNSILRANNYFNWGIFREEIPKINYFKKLVLTEFNCNKNSKIIFQPIGLWQEKVMAVVANQAGIRLGYDYYFQTYIPLISNYLSKVSEKVLYILISGNVHREIIYKQDALKVIILPPQKHNTFMKYLNASDIFVTDNLMSSNLGKAVFNKTPSLTLRNSIYRESNDSLNSAFVLTEKVKDIISLLYEKDILFPYYCFPLGLCEIGCMYENNTFTSCFDIAEIYNEKECSEAFCNLLFNQEHRVKQINKQSEYITRNNKLMSAYDIIHECL